MAQRFGLGAHGLGLGLRGVDARLRSVEVVAVLGAGASREVALRDELLFQGRHALPAARGLIACSRDRVVHGGARREMRGVALVERLLQDGDLRLRVGELLVQGRHVAPARVRARLCDLRRRAHPLELGDAIGAADCAASSTPPGPSVAGVGRGRRLCASSGAGVGRPRRRALASA